MNINLLTEVEVESLNRLIDEANHIAIYTHRSPDGDAIGSTLGMANYLKQRGKEDVKVIVPDMFPNFLQWLPGTMDILRHDKKKEEAEAATRNADLLLCLDFNDASRTAELEPLITESTAHKVLIDHHLNPTVDADVSVSHPEACSTCELVFRLIWQLGGFEEMDKNVAVPIYCGMMTDTGGFTYNSNRPEIFFIISQLLTKGINKDKIYRNVFNNFSPWAIRLRGYLMSQKLNIFNDLHASYFIISRRDMRDFHFMKGDAEGLVNEPLKIKGMRLSVSLREDDRRDNTIWVSLRSVDDFPCNLVASEFFNGGGHLNASGGRLNCTLDEAERVVRRAFAHYEDLLTK